MKPEPDNMECFAAACGAVLGELAGAFPRAVDLNAADLQAELVRGGRLAGSCAWCDEEREANLVSATLDYLLAEGMIRCGDGPFPPLYPAVVLTARGFTILQSPAGAGETLGGVLRKAGKMTGAAVISQTVGAVFRLLGGGAP